MRGHDHSVCVIMNIQKFICKYMYWYTVQMHIQYTCKCVNEVLEMHMKIKILYYMYNLGVTIYMYMWMIHMNDLHFEPRRLSFPQL